MANPSIVPIYAYAEGEEPQVRYVALQKAFGWLWLAIIAIAMVGNVAAESIKPGTPEYDWASRIFKVLIVSLFAAQAICLPPALLHTFVFLQRKAGNVALAQSYEALERPIVLAFWTIYGLGALIVVPYLLWQNRPEWLEAMLHRSKGTLVVDVGMAIDEVAKRSTIRMPTEPAKVKTGIPIVGDFAFDAQIGEGPVFSGCRYFWIISKDARRVHDVNFGISPRNQTKAKLTDFLKSTGEKLRAAGWSRGRYDWSREQNHLPAAPDWDGYLWAKGASFLNLHTRRMDDEKRDEAADAGLFILYGELSPLVEARRDVLVFSPPL
jgi:hypothetical protein